MLSRFHLGLASTTSFIPVHTLLMCQVCYSELWFKRSKNSELIKINKFQRSPRIIVWYSNDLDHTSSMTLERLAVIKQKSSLWLVFVLIFLLFNILYFYAPNNTYDVRFQPFIASRLTICNNIKMIFVFLGDKKNQDDLGRNVVNVYNT